MQGKEAACAREERNSGGVREIRVSPRALHL
jgi:hypothetical protein